MNSEEKKLPKSFFYFLQTCNDIRRSANNKFNKKRQGKMASLPMRDNKNSGRPGYWLIFLLVFFFIFAYFPVFNGLIDTWSSSDEYSHGFLIIPICIYLLWHKKDELAAVQYKPSIIGLFIIITAICLYIVSYHAEITTIASVSMIVFIIGCILYLYGFRMLMKTIFILFLLLFMIPIPSQIYSILTIPLQLFVSKISFLITHHMGLPIYREGNVIYLPNKTFEIVNACSGLRSMISLLTLSAIIGYFSLNFNHMKVVLFLSGIPAAILANIFRVVLMILAFQWFGFDLSTGEIHTVFGIVVFIFAFALLILFRGVLSIWDKKAIVE